jgi:prepilin-type N-terminal cleavage/methylation domain-containing protein
MTLIKPSVPRRLGDGGFSIIELLIVVALIGIISAMAVPQLLASRRLQRAAALPELVKSQLRLARQHAMTRRRAVTFQYDDQTKQLVLITHVEAGSGVLSDENYPNTDGSVQGDQLSLLGEGGRALGLVYGLAPGGSGDLGDGTTLTPLSGEGQLNITFQPDGSVIDADGVPADYALFFYNEEAPGDTARAVSVLGSSGRVKTWKYNSHENHYFE